MANEEADTLDDHMIEDIDFRCLNDTETFASVQVPPLALSSEIGPTQFTTYTELKPEEGKFEKASSYALAKDAGVQDSLLNEHSDQPPRTFCPWLCTGRFLPRSYIVILTVVRRRTCFLKLVLKQDWICRFEGRFYYDER